MRKWPATLLFPLAQRRSFWRFRRLWDRTVFGYSRFVFDQRDRLRTKREDLGIFLTILKSTSLYTLAIVGLLVCVEGAERLLVRSGWTFGILTKHTDKSYASTDYALQTLTGLQGVFLAVYLTAVSVAASAIYADVPHEVRSLLARDRLGNFFLQFVAACTAVALMLLGYRGLGGTTGKGVLFFSILFGCYSIFAILLALKTSITLFDPAKVGRIIFHDFVQAVRSASIDGFAWTNRSFQVGYSNHAAHSLKTLGMLVDICARKPGAGNQPLSDLLADTLSVWGRYAYFRGRIPFESDWYRSIHRHKRWLLARDYEVAIALGTQTTLSPEKQKDRNWLEAKLLPILERGVITLLERGDVLAAHEALVKMSRLVRCLAGQLDTTNVAAFQSIVTRTADRWSQLATEKEGRDKTHESLEEIGLADLLGMIPIDVALGIGDWARAFDFNGLEKHVREVDWGKEKATYKCGMPYGSLGDVAKLREELAFEIAAEGRRISANWYVQERILLGLMRALHPCLAQIMEIINGAFVERSEELLESKRYRSSAELVSRGFEFIDKFSLSLMHLKKIVDGVQSRSKIKDLPWPAFDFKDTEKKLKELWTALLKLLGKMVPMLGFMPDDPTLPDFFGQCYVKVLEETFAALIRNDEEFFTQFFPVSFIGGITAYDKLDEHIRNWNRSAAIAVKGDVLIDILELGSYAKFFSEYRGKPQYWDVCVSTWDHFLSNHGNPQALIDHIVTLVGFQEHQFIFSARRSSQLRWQQELMSLLRQDGSLVDVVYRPGRRPGHHLHSSKLVRKVCTTGGLGIDWPGPDIFLIAYFENHWKLESPLRLRDSHRMREALGADS